VFHPLICLRHRDDANRRRAARRLIHRVFALHVKLTCRLGVMELRIDGAELLRGSRGELIVANHPMLYDVVCLIAHLPDADCIVKNSLWNNLFTRGPIRAADYIHNDGSPALIERCAQRLRGGASLVIFPEGTRTVRGACLNPLQRGAANILARSGAPCRPVIIRCVPLTLTKHEKWYRIPERRWRLSLKVHELLPIASIVAGSAGPAIAARRINEALQTYFTTELRAASRSDYEATGSDS
jgi:1-acyl-sn-glycerol-3-phosphate acyltransferase